MALWAWANRFLALERLPGRRVVVQFDFWGLPKRHARHWMIFDGERPEVCATYPGFEVELFVKAEPRALVEWNLGRITWADASELIVSGYWDRPSSPERCRRGTALIPPTRRPAARPQTEPAGPPGRPERRFLLLAGAARAKPIEHTERAAHRERWRAYVAISDASVGGGPTAFPTAEPARDHQLGVAVGVATRQSRAKVRCRMGLVRLRRASHLSLLRHCHRDVLRRSSAPHFHAKYAEHEAQIVIETGAVLSGSLPRRALGLVQEWVLLHRDELVEDWRRAERQEPLASIEPLP